MHNFLGRNPFDPPPFPEGSIHTRIFTRLVPIENRDDNPQNEPRPVTISINATFLLRVSQIVIWFP